MGEQSLLAIKQEKASPQISRATDSAPSRSLPRENPAPQEQPSKSIPAAASTRDASAVPRPAPIPMNDENSSSASSTSSSDLAESYMEKLTRLRSKYNSRRGQAPPMGDVGAGQVPRATGNGCGPAFGGLDMPKPSLVEIKKQFQHVKAMSPHKPPASERAMRPNQLCPPSPQSPSPSSSAL